MPEVWLRTNRRALLVMMILPGVLLLASAVGLAWSLLTRQHALISVPIALVVLLLAWLFVSLALAWKSPRLAYESGELLVYLKPGPPTRVPIDIVEVFFLGQGASELPKLAGREPETQNIVVRLAESATEWKHRDVPPAIGHWCESYITLRGSWCEPITPELMQQMNQRLIEVHRERRALKQQAEAAS